MRADIAKLLASEIIGSFSTLTYKLQKRDPLSVGAREEGCRLREFGSEPRGPMAAGAITRRVAAYQSACLAGELLRWNRVPQVIIEDSFRQQFFDVTDTLITRTFELLERHTTGAVGLVKLLGPHA